MKVLIVSYGSVAMNTNGGKTFLSVLSDFEKKDLMNFYVSPNHPDNDWCSTYYYQNEMDLLFPWKNKRKTHIIRDYKLYDVKNDRTIVYKNSHRSRDIKLLIRDLLWRVSHWKTEEFREWMQEGKPDVIVADTGDSEFMYRLAIDISKEYRIPVVCHFGDDYYFLKASKYEVFKKIRLFILRKAIKKIINYSSSVVVLNERFAELYRKEFGLDANKITAVYNSSNFIFEGRYTVNNMQAISLSYLGNLTLGRWENLIQIGKCLDDINQRKGTKHHLFVYGNELTEFSQQARSVSSISYEGFVSGEEVKRIIGNSDVLVHTESFLPVNIEQTKMSFSTKIADSLCSGRCLFAYGPGNITSMEHLINNDCAYTVIEPAKLEEGLNTLLSSKQILEEYAQKGLNAGKIFHDPKTNSKTFGMILNNAKNNSYYR